ncbi:MAG: flagellar basal body-associated FliL family protein [Pseudomonadota bacterium]
MSEDKAKSSLMPTLVALVVSIGIGAGGAFGLNVTQAPLTDEPAAAETEAKAESEQETAQRTLTALPALLTNLAPPGDTWVRLEASLMSEESIDDETLADIQRDVLAYLRTVHLSQVEGATGYLDFRDALEERARLHSGDPDMRFLVRTLLFE